jgi:hypothetical protein
METAFQSPVFHNGLWNSGLIPPGAHYLAPGNFAIADFSLLCSYSLPLVLLPCFYCCPRFEGVLSMAYAQRPAPPAPAPGPSIKPYLAGGVLFAALGFLVDFQGMRQWVARSGAQQPAEQCEAIVQTNARLSRDQLAKLLTVPERDDKASIREIISEPYCRLPALQVRAGVKAEREAYPLAFDPGTQLVILYEDDEYAGYRFRFE